MARQKARYVRFLGGAKARVISGPTKRDAYYLNGEEISRESATTLCLDHLQVDSVNGAMSAVRMRDCTTAEKPVQTDHGAYWRALVPIDGEVR